LAQGRETPEQTRARLEERCRRELAAGGEVDESVLRHPKVREVVPLIVEAARTEAVNATPTAWEQAYERRIGDEIRAFRDRLREAGFTRRSREDQDFETAERLFAEARERSAAGDTRRAEWGYVEALKLYERVGHEHAAGVCLANLARIDVKLERLDSARSRFERAAEIQNRLGFQEAAGSVYLQLGLLAKRRGDRDGARELFGKALTRYTNAGRRDGEEAHWLMREIREL